VALVRFAGPAAQHRYAEDLNVEVLFNDELVIVAGQEEPMGSRSKSRPRKAGRRSLDTAALTTSNSKTVFEAFRECGLGAPKVFMATFSVHLRTSMVADGTYVSVLPRSMVRQTADRSNLKILPHQIAEARLPHWHARSGLKITASSLRVRPITTANRKA
jgi:DNA-binding transcriptional LysR family regulator